MTQKTPSPHFKSIQRDGIVVDILDSVKQALLTDELKPGQRIPSETELMREFGVGRNSIREAMKMLQALGVVEVRRGDGTYVVDKPSLKNFQPLIFAMLLRINATKELVELRTMTEIGYCQLAGQCGTEEDFAAIRDAGAAWEAEVMKKKPDLNRVLQLDMQYHRAIIAATHNELVAMLAETVEEIFFQTIRQVHTQERVLRYGLEGHRRITESLSTRDPIRIYEAVTFSLEYWKSQFIKNEADKQTK
ncbi:MAG: hypothetical protein CL607_17215 [Anaerolineaceae bacterium]|nr:hypothetical protein [Anaerolineaceae bacterium]